MRSLFLRVVSMGMAGFLASPVMATSLDFFTDKADVTLISKGSIYHDNDRPSVLANWDFNGDGFDDIAFYHLGSIQVFLGGELPRLSTLDDQENILISVGSFLAERTLSSADLDGDGKDDLIVQYSGFWSPGGPIRIIYGQENPLPRTIDVTVPDPLGLTIVGAGTTKFGETVASGDVDGDGYLDLLIGAPQADPAGRTDAGEVYLLRGRKERRVGTLDVLTSTEVCTFRGRSAGDKLGSSLVLGELNGDNRRELFLSASGARPSGRVNAGEIFVVKGQAWTSFPSSWDFQASSPSLAILGGPTESLSVGVSGDFNADGRGDLTVGHSWILAEFLIDGIDMEEAINTTKLIDLLPGSPDYRSPKTLGLQSPEIGDFDGDGQPDLFGGYNRLAQGYLSSANFFTASGLASASMNVEVSRGYIGGLTLGDINGDNYGDWVIMELPNVQSGIFKGALYVFYGFHPLFHPVIHVREREGDSTAVTLELTVDGDPTEVRVSGDVAENIKDRWVPFQAILPVRLTPGLGDKKVQVTFRNRFNRESEPAEDTVTLTPGPSQSKSLTNILRAEDGPHGRVTVEVSLSDATHLKARVYDRGGQLLATLIDEERGAGVWTVDWQGLNAAGRRVSPGIYILVVETNGHIEKHKIIVRG